MTNHEYIIAVLRVAEQYEIWSELLWRVSADGAVRFYIGCSDLFTWGSADAEEITMENLPLLEPAIIDALAADSVGGEIYGTSLFCCRSSKCRPQKSVAAHIAKFPRLLVLFKAVGTGQEVRK